MNLLNNALGAIGLSHGNILKSALKMVGLPDGIASAAGAVLDLKNGNFGSLLFKTGPDLLKALGGGGCGAANSCARPSSVLGTVLKVAGFAAGGVALASLLGGGGSLAKVALGGLGAIFGSKLGIAGALGFGAVALAGGLGFGLLGHGSQGARKDLGMTRTQGGPDSALSRLPKPCTFEDMVSAFMIDFVKDKQKEIEGKLDNLRQKAANAEGSKAEGGANGFFGGLLSSIPFVGDKLQGAVGNGSKNESSESRNIEFEQLKNEMQKLSQMQQAMSNVLNEMHTLAQSAIRKIGG